MAKKATHNGPGSGGEESISGYFRDVFKENPKLLKTRSNADVLQRWLSDHPGVKAVPHNVKVGLMNVKSRLRSNRRRRIRREDAERPAGAAAPARRPPRGLERIEEMIDDTMSAAKTHDREGLQHVIELLRRARNVVVWKQGQ
jgi:hypothetical protein